MKDHVSIGWTFYRRDRYSLMRNKREVKESAVDCYGDGASSYLPYRRECCRLEQRCLLKKNADGRIDGWTMCGLWRRHGREKGDDQSEDDDAFDLIWWPTRWPQHCITLRVEIRENGRGAFHRDTIDPSFLFLFLLSILFWFFSGWFTLWFLVGMLIATPPYTISLMIDWIDKKGRETGAALNLLHGQRAARGTSRSIKCLHSIEAHYYIPFLLADREH